MYFSDFLVAQTVKNMQCGKSACSAGDLDSVSGSGRFSGERAWQPTLVFLPGDFSGPFSMGKNKYLHFFPKIKVEFY